MSEFENGFAVDWNDGSWPNGDLPGKVPPGGGDPPDKGSSSLFAFASMLADAQLYGRTISESYQIYFPQGTRYLNGIFEFIFDPGCECDQTELMKSTSEFFLMRGNDNGQLAEEFNAIRITLFVSTYANKLNAAYNCVQPGDEEIVMFLEDNTGDISSTLLKAKIGKNVSALLKENLELLESNTVLDAVNLYGNHTLDRDQLHQLIQKGYAENHTLELFSIFFRGSFFSKVKSFGYDKAADLVAMVNKFIENSLKLGPADWNPYLGGTENPDFVPTLFPFAPALLKEYGDNVNDFLHDAIQRLEENFQKNDQVIRDLLSKDIGQLHFEMLRVPINIDLFPDSVEKVMRTIYLAASRRIQQTFDDLKSLDFAFLLERGIYIANAFLCGLWNSLVDAVCGLLSTLEMIYRIQSKYHEFKADVVNTFKKLLEQLDDIRHALLAIDFGRVFRALVDKLRQIDLFKLIFETPIEVLAYYQGALLGFIIVTVIEIVVGILISGGALSVEIVLQELTKKITSAVTGGITGTVESIKSIKKKLKKGSGSIDEGIAELIEFLLEGTEGIVELIEKVWAWFQETFGQGAAKLGENGSLLTEILTLQAVYFFQEYQLSLAKRGTLYDIIYQKAVIWTGDKEQLKSLWLKINAMNSKNVKKWILERARLAQIDTLMKKLGIVDIPVNPYSESDSPKQLGRTITRLKKKKDKLFRPGKQALKDNQLRLSKSNIGLTVDFSKEPFLFDSEQSTVNIKITGSRKNDERLAYELSGIAQQKEGAYSWHYLDDYNPIDGTCTMQLVETRVLRLCFPHYSGVKLISDYLNIVYR